MPLVLIFNFKKNNIDNCIQTIYRLFNWKQYTLLMILI